jgi:hypothetical protein
MRHGTTEMNVHLGTVKPGYGEPGFADPMLFDTTLTEAGRRGARAAAKKVARLSPKPEVRARRGAELACGGGLCVGGGFHLIDANRRRPAAAGSCSGPAAQL